MCLMVYVQFLALNASVGVEKIVNPFDNLSQQLVRYTMFGLMVKNYKLPQFAVNWSVT